MFVLSLPGKQHCLVAGNWNLRGTPPIASLPRLKGVTGVRLQASSYTLSEVTFQPRDHQPLSKGLELETVCKPDWEISSVVHGGLLSTKMHVSLHNICSSKPLGSHS